MINKAYVYLVISFTDADSKRDILAAFTSRASAEQFVGQVILSTGPTVYTYRIVEFPLQETAKFNE